MANELIIDTKDFKRLTIELNKLKGDVPGALASAINRTVDFTSTQISKEVREEYVIKAKDVKATLKKRRASRGNTNASITSEGHTLSLMRFKVTPRKPSKKSKQVKVQIKKRSGKKPINTSPKAFVQQMNNAVGVFRREGASRFPVVMLRTLSIPQMISNAEVYDKVNTVAKAKLDERLAHELDYRITKAKQKLEG